MTTGRKMVLFGILIFGFLFVSSVFFSFKDKIFLSFFFIFPFSFFSFYIAISFDSTLSFFQVFSLVIWCRG